VIDQAPDETASGLGASPGAAPAGPRRSLVAGTLAALVLLLSHPLLAALPSSSWERVDVAVGFGLGVPAAAVLSWSLLSARIDWPALTVLLVIGLILGFGLSAAGWVWPAVPAKVVAATAAGCLLGRVVEEASWLLFAAAAILLADSWSVFAGPTKAVVERAPGVLDYLLVHFSALGQSQAATGLGMTDLLFVAFFTVGAAATGLRPTVSFAAMVVSFGLTLLLTLTLERPLPALPLLALAFVAVNADRFWALRPRRRARRPV